MGFEDADGSIPWEMVNPFPKEQQPGVNLFGGRHKENLTQAQLAEMTGIPQRHISEMERGKRAIGKDRAKILGKSLNIDYRLFL